MELVNTNAMVKYVKTDDILGDMQSIINASQNAAYQAVNLALIRRNWLLGYRIAEEELKGEERAEYGAGIIKKLSKELTAIYGHGFTKSNLYSFTLFIRLIRRFSRHRLENSRVDCPGLIMQLCYR